MNPDELFVLVQRMSGSMEALGALAAQLRIEAEGLTPDPAVERALLGVIRALGVDPAELAALPAEQKHAVAGGIRAFLRQATELAENPTRTPGWTLDEPSFLQAQGRLSSPIAGIVSRIAPSLGDLAARLASDGASFLDVGTGVGWLAIAMATTFPRLNVVGIDVFPPALALARENVARASFSNRIELREQSVVELSDRDRFDLAFVAGPFLSQAMVPQAIERTRDALRQGGILLFGMFATVDDPLAVATQAVRVVRSGGHPWDLAEARSVLEAAGLADAKILDRTWKAPVVFVAARKP